MSLTIKNNTSSLIAQNSLKTSTSKLNQAIERMSSGAKINHAKDNAANYSIATNMTTKINALQVAEDNCAMGLDLISTASSSLEQMSGLTSRLRSLATQAQNGTYDKSLEIIQKEADELISELARISSNTMYNGINILQDTTMESFIDSINRRSTSSMVSLSSIDEDNITLLKGSYSISSVEELLKLANLSKDKKIDFSAEFVLANDIDLSEFSTGEGWSPIQNFTGTFDGNGYRILNLYTNRNSDYQGLFGRTNHLAKIINLGLVNVNVTGANNSGALVGDLYFSTVSNCYVSGSVAGKQMLGGLVGMVSSGSSVIDCYSDVDVSCSSNYSYSGGFCGFCSDDSKIKGCYSNGSIRGSRIIGGFAGKISNGAKVSNCYSTGNTEGTITVGGFVGTLEGDTTNCYFVPDTTGVQNGIGYGNGSCVGVTHGELNDLINQKLVKLNGLFSQGANISIQTGGMSSNSNQISLSICGTSALRLIGLKMNDKYALKTLDAIFDEINEQQTTLGAAQNRLESALDEISTQYENLVSSRSTIMDADMAEVSSEYIRQQILQEASATLMATANQSPSIALQLL